MPVNYLNNKDILKEIHKSKNTYCSYVREGYDRYDIIVPSLDKINIRTVAQAKRNRASAMQKEAYETAKLTNKKVKQAEFAVKWQKIAKTDLTFRVMTYDHIPLEPGRKRKPKTEADHRAKINFPPFQHYKFDASDKLKCVGRARARQRPRAAESTHSRLSLARNHPHSSRRVRARERCVEDYEPFQLHQ